MKKKILYLFLLLPFVSLFAQNADVSNLQKQLSKASSDTSKMGTLIKLIETYAPINLDSSIFYFEEVLQLAQKNNHHKNIILAQKTITDNLMDKGAFTKVKIIIDEGIELGHQLQNDSIICRNLITLVTWHWKMSNTKKSFEVMSQALDYAHKAKSVKYKAMVLSSYGIFYGDQGDLDKEQEYYQKSLQIFEEIKDTTNQIILLQNLANSYFYAKDFSTALQYTNQALELIKIFKTKGLLYQHVLGFKGNILYNLGKTELGFSILDSVLVMANSNNNSRLIVLINNEKSKWLLKDKKYNEAISAANIGVKICKKTGYIHQLPELCHTLNQSYTAKKDFESALLWTNEENQATKEIRTRQQDKELILLEANHELLQKETENKMLLLKNNNQKMLIAIAIILGLVFSFFTYYFFRKKHLKKLETFRQKVAADLHDDVGSNLNNITRIAKGLKTSDNSIEINKGIDNLIQKSNEAILNIVDLVWTLDNEEAKLFSLIGKMESYLDIVKANNKKVKVNLIKNNLDFSKSLTIEMRHHLLMIFKEATNNIQKHTESSIIEIKINNNNNKFLMSFFNEFDTKKECLNSTGRGISNIKKRVSELNGTVNIKETSNSYFLQIELDSIA